jgi:hypothetical protein
MGSIVVSLPGRRRDRDGGDNVGVGAGSGAVEAVGVVRRV